MRNETRLVTTPYSPQIGPAQRRGRWATTVQRWHPRCSRGLKSKIQESSDFLGSINMTPVVEARARKLGLGVSGPMASRTDTNSAPPNARLHHAGRKGYQCVQTNYDTHLQLPQAGPLGQVPRLPDPGG